MSICWLIDVKCTENASQRFSIVRIILKVIIGFILGIILLSKNQCDLYI